MFKNNKYWVSLIILLGYFIQFLLSKFSLIHLNINENILRNIISIAIGSLSSILGILVSILILSINITEKTISEQMKNTILDYKPLSYYFQVSISTLLIMISANFLLNETVSNLAINITLYGTLFYIISILLLVSTMKQVIKKASSKESILDVLKCMNEQEAKDYLHENFDQNNSFYSITLIGVNLINNKDRISLRTILNYFEKILIKKIDETEPKIANQLREILNAYVKVQYNFLKEVNSENREWVLHEIIETYKNIRIKGIKQNIPFYDFIEYDEFIEKCIIKTFKFDNSDLSQISLWVFGELYKANLNYFVPSENKTQFGIHNDGKFEANEEFDDLLHSQWTYISSTLLYKFKNIINKIDFNNEQLIIACVMDYNNMIGKTLKSNNLSINQRNSLIKSLANYLKDFIILSIRNNKEYEPFLTLIHIYNDMKNEKKTSYYWLISIMIELLFSITKHNRLNKHILNDFGTVGRSLAKDITKDENAKLVILKLFKGFSKVAAKIESNKNLKTYDNYVEIYKQMESIIIWIKKDNSSISDELLNELQTILDELVYYDEFKQLLNSEEIHIEQYFIED